MKEKTETQRREVAEENADTARLDWLEEYLKTPPLNITLEVYGQSFSIKALGLRAAIDAARDAWNKRAPLTPLRSGLLQDALEALDFVCRIWSKPSDPTPSDVKECYEACRIVLARANAEGVSLISSASTKPTVTTRKTEHGMGGANLYTPVGGVETKTDEEIAHAFAVNISNIGLLDSDRPFIELAAKDILSAIREACAAKEAK